jgi:adenylate kinase
MKNIIFIAPPAAGKGTQSAYLEDKYGYVHLSTGDMLREVAKENSSFGLEIKNLIDNGKFVSDDIMVNIIKKRIDSLNGKPFILDGFPRTLPQAEYLKNIINDDYEVIYLSIPEDIAMKRALGRITCPKCGRSYNIYFEQEKPSVENVCNNCHSPLEKRKDDNEESFKERFQTYLMKTSPLLKYYENLNKLKEVDVNKDSKEIFKDIEAIIND